jgi:DnaJ-class molecular chaperone
MIEEERRQCSSKNRGEEHPHAQHLCQHIAVKLIYFLICRGQHAADPFSIFEQFGFGGMGGRSREDPHTPNVEIPLRVTLRQLYLGEILDLSYSRQVLCAEASSCQVNKQECQGPGIGMRMHQLAPGFMQQMQVNDPTCVARGKAWKQNCKACPRGIDECT